MREMKRDVEELLDVKIDVDITKDHIEAAIEICEEILLICDDKDIYETMIKLERQLYK